MALPTVWCCSQRPGSSVARGRSNQLARGRSNQLAREFECASDVDDARGVHDGRDVDDVDDGRGACNGTGTISTSRSREEAILQPAQAGSRGSIGRIA